MKNDEQKYNVDVVDGKDEDEGWNDQSIYGTLIKD